MVEDEGQERKSHERVPRNDKIAILILIFLYILQGIPLGLINSLKMILQNKNVSYKDQATFSLVGWPFSLKLLWAPIVDSLYWKCLGRRKSWLISVQYLIGFLMLFLSTSVSSFLGDSNSSPNVWALTVTFFCLTFLAATQDIAVDGWALTMLSRQNVGFASVCNSAGQRIGFFLGNVVFLILESAEFCNQYLRSVPHPEGLVTLDSFLKISGIIFIVTTTLLLVFKSEREEKCSDTCSLKDTYYQLYHIMCLKNVLVLLSFLLTYHIAIAAADSVTKLKFVEAGLHKENLALLEIPIVLVQIMLPLYISRYTTGPNPLNVFLKGFPYKLMFGLLFAILVWWTRYVRLESGAFPTYYYFVIVLSFMLHQTFASAIFVSIGSFCNRVSDPSIGGTYMTLLNTFANLGGSWTSTLVLWLVDVFTVKKCSNSLFSCDTTELALKCTDAGHNCLTIMDGYTIESIACVIFGFVWLRWARRIIHKLQVMPLSEWKIPQYTLLQGLDKAFLKA